MADPHKNFSYSTVATAPSPATSGTSLVVATGDGAKFPTVPFNATIWPVSAQPTTANAEIVRVTAISTDTLTITRAQESSSARTVIVGDQIAATVTAKTLTDVELNVYVTDQDKTIPATTEVIFDDYLELAASFFYELSAAAVLVIGDFATPLPPPDQNPNIFITVNDETVPSNSEIVFSDFYELSQPFSVELARDSILVVGTGFGVLPPGYEFDYVETTTSLTVTATTEGASQAFITGNPVQFDGSTRVKIEFGCANISLTGTGSTIAGVTSLFMDGSSLGWLTENGYAPTTSVSAPGYGAFFVTPTAGMHSFVINAWKTGGTFILTATPRSTKNEMPAWYRITKA